MIKNGKSTGQQRYASEQWSAPTKPSASTQLTQTETRGQTANCGDDASTAVEWHCSGIACQSSYGHSGLKKIVHLEPVNQKLQQLKPEERLKKLLRQGIWGSCDLRVWAMKCVVLSAQVINLRWLAIDHHWSGISLYIWSPSGWSLPTTQGVIRAVWN